MSTLKPKVYLDPLGIVRVEYAEEGLITLEAVQYTQTEIQQCATAPVRVLATIHGKTTATNEAKEFVAHIDSRDLITAQAYVVKSIETGLALTDFLLFHEPPYPCQAFNDETEALAWLANFA